MTPKKPPKVSTDVLFKNVPLSLYTHWKAWNILRGKGAKERFIENMKRDIAQKEVQS